MTDVIHAQGLGRAYGRRWALHDCTISLPEGRVVGLVGPNGAGKTTLLHMAVGLLEPTTGTIEVLGARPAQTAEQLQRIGFVAQEAPLYSGMSVRNHLRMGAWTNPSWDAPLAERRLEGLRIDVRQKAGTLSGGQRAQLALTLAVSKRPDLLILDEPVASLDPLARRDFLRSLMEIVAEHGVSVVLSSHLVADLERVCDHLVVLCESHVQLAGGVDELVATHHRMTGPRRDPASLASSLQVIEESHTERQTSLLVRSSEPIFDPSWTVTAATLEDIVIAYMSAGAPAAPPTPNPAQLAVAG
jgi:ABC-2 type transport system ATP-binding protein